MIETPTLIQGITMPVSETKMERTTISLPENQMKQMNVKVELGEFPNFSEAVRTAIREYIERHPIQSSEAAACPTA